LEQAAQRRKPGQDHGERQILPLLFCSHLSTASAPSELRAASRESIVRALSEGTAFTWVERHSPKQKHGV